MLTENNRKDILQGLLETIKSISDIEYQRRAWILGRPPGTDFDETVNNYAPEAEGVLRDYKNFLISEAQFRALKRFDEHFRSFWKENHWPPDFIDTPEWDEIVNMAKEVLAAFDYKG